METAKSAALFHRARQLMPGGVNSPVRAFGSVGMEPLFIDRAKGAHIWDVDGNRYIDYVGSWGPMILGHADEDVLEAVATAMQKGLSFGAPCAAEVELAGLVCEMTGVEMVRMVNSGTEAVMSALRVARGVTGRDKIVKFEGCYHGHSDSMLVKAGSGALTAGTPSSAGVPAPVAADTLTARFGDLDSVQGLLEANREQVAAVIVEPVAANMGVVPPPEGFLRGLRALCDKYGALLIFDEVITGFRLSPGGAQEYFGVRADLVTYGKIIGGGLPVGAYAGRREILEQVAPCGPVYQAGTLSGNPVAMAAGLCQLRKLRDGRGNIYPDLTAKTARLAQGLRDAAEAAKIPAHVNQIGSLCCAYFAADSVTGYERAVASDTGRYAAFFRGMLHRGVYLAPSQFEAMFLGIQHTDQMIDDTLQAAREALEELKGVETAVKGILVLAHGSRAKETEQTLEAVVAMVRERFPGHLLQIAYMEFGDVNIEKGLDGLATRGCDEIAVVPYFLFDGVHIKEDIPREIEAYCAEHPGVTVRMGGTLGADSRLADILADRIRACL